MPNSTQIMIVTKNKNAIVKILDAKTGNIILSHRIPAGAQRPKIYGKSVDWLKRNLLPEQAEIIRRAYEANKRGKKLAIIGPKAIAIYNEMPQHVRNLLRAYFGVFVAQKKAIVQKECKPVEKEKPLHNISPEEQEKEKQQESCVVM